MGTNTWLNVGRITGVHGLAGNLKVWSHAHSPETFAKGRKIRLVSEGETQGIDDTVANYVHRNKGVLLTLKGVGTREQAEALVNKDILINREDLPELEEDTWYWEDLTGLSVTDETLGEIGTIDHLFSTGADDILVVKAGGREILIPMNRHFVRDVDLGSGSLRVRLPEGFTQI